MIQYSIIKRTNQQLGIYNQGSIIIFRHKNFIYLKNHLYYIFKNQDEDRKIPLNSNVEFYKCSPNLAEILMFIYYFYMRSFTNISINSMDDPIYDSNTTFFKEMSKRLDQASSCLTFTEFNLIFKQVIRKCIKKAEVDSTFTQALPCINKWLSTYSYDLEIIARILILQSVTMCKELPAEAMSKLNKVKHLLVDTDFQYLLPKVFIIESRIHEITNDRQAKLKSLKKCIQFGQNYALQYLKQSNQIRLEIADNMIIAYFQVYKLIKQTKPNVSVEYLSKAYQAALKNYGHQHFSTLSLAQVLNQQKNLLVNMERFMPKALSQIQVTLIKKNTQLSILYSWQEQLLVVQLYKIKGDQQKYVSESTLSIKLDMQKIKLLKTKNYNEWIQFSGSEIKIIEEQLKRIIVPIEVSKIQKVTTQNLRQIGKGDIYRADRQPEQLSSSSDDQAIVSEHQQKFLGFLQKDRANQSRSKSKETSRH